MSSMDASEAVTMTKFTLLQVNLSPAAAQAPMSLQWIGQDKRLQMMLIMLLAKVFSVCFFSPVVCLTELSLTYAMCYVTLFFLPWYRFLVRLLSCCWKITRCTSPHYVVNLV